jgi:hypothetical protein
MRADDRDVRLGEALDRAVRSIGPSSRLPLVLRRGARLRRFRSTAIVVCVAVFVSGVTWAAVGLRGQHRQLIGANGLEVYEGPGGDWSVGFPPSWHVTSIGQDCDAFGYSGGVIVSSADFEFRHPSGGLGECDGRFVMAGFPRDGVGLALQPMGASFGPISTRADTALPLTMAQLIGTESIRGGPAAPYLVIYRNNTPVYRLGAWIGEDATSSDRVRLAEVVSSIIFRGAPRWTTHHSDLLGLSFRHPENWVVSRPRSLFEGPQFPSLSIATPRVGRDGRCFAPGVVNAWAVSDDAVVTITAVPPVLVGPAPPRPDRFGPRSGAPTGPSRCVPPGRTLARTIRFQEGGRVLVVRLVVGGLDAGDVRNTVFRILDSLRFGPR